MLFSLCLLPEFSCKKDEPQVPDDELVELVTLIASAGNRFDAFVDSDRMRVTEAILATRDWLQTQPDVATVHAWDSVCLFLTTPEGLQGSLMVDRLDASGNCCIP